MKEWLIDLTQNTIIAVVITLLWYVLGVDKSWNDATTTFATAFLVLFVITLYQRYKKNKKK